MTELIKITTNNGQQAVSARDLHKFLESKQDFSTWIKARIEKYGFIENQDYTTFHKIVERSKSNEYALTFDSAKELSMVEGNAKGKQARQYFIECERLAKSAPIKLPNIKELAQMLIASEEDKERLQIVNDLQTLALKEAQPKVKFCDEVLSSNSTYNTNLIAKELGTSAVSLNKILKDKGVQYFQNGTWVLKSEFQNKEFTKTKTFLYTSANGESKTSMLTVWTEKGRMFIHSIIKS